MLFENDPIHFECLIRRDKEGRGYTTLVTKGDAVGRKVHADSKITNNKKKKLVKNYYVQIFIFHLILVSAAAAELCLPFHWWCRFKHWLESARAG